MKTRQWFEIPPKEWYRGWDRTCPGKDAQRQKVYNAERELLLQSEACEKVSPRFTKLQDVQDYVDKLVQRAWLQRRYFKPAPTHRMQRFRDGLRIEVRDGRGRWRTACADYRYMKLPRFARTEAIILHELAHCLTWWYKPGHGPLWCRWYLELVQHQIGKAAAKQLKESFRQHKVQFMPYRNPAHYDHMRGRSPAAFKQKSLCG